MEFLEGMKITFVEREGFVQKNLADKIAIITTDDIGIICAHDSKGPPSSLVLAALPCTRVACSKRGGFLA